MAEKRERREIDFNTVLLDGAGEAIRIAPDPHKFRLGSVATRGLSVTMKEDDDPEQVIRLNSLVRSIVNQEALGQPVDESVQFTAITLPERVIKILDDAAFRYAQRLRVSMLYDSAHSALYPDEKPLEFDDIDVRLPELSEIEREDSRKTAAEPPADDTEDPAAE